MFKQVGFPLKEFTIAGLVFVTAFAFFHFTNADLFISDFAFELTSFESCKVLTILAILGKYSSVLFALLLVVGFLKKNSETPYRRRECFFGLVVIVVGVGAIPNYVLKPTFSCPRPYEIQRYDSSQDKEFVKVLVPAKDKSSRSFSSGHAGAAFFFLTPWFIGRLRKKYGWKLFVPAFLWGGTISLVRVLQGNHFVSDCLGSLAVVYFTSLLASYAFGLYRDQ